MKILELNNFGVRFGSRIALRDVTLDLQQGEVFVIMGPGGAGKSSLVRTICGANDVIPTLAIDGEALYQGQEIGEGNHPTLVPQRLSWSKEKVRDILCCALPNRENLTLPQQDEFLQNFLAKLGLADIFEQRAKPWWDLESWQVRALGLVRASLQNQPLLCVDEPGASLATDGRAKLLEVMGHLKERHTLLWITHHQASARELGDRVALIAGARLQEINTSKAFFTSPTTPAAQSFIRSGGCDVPAPEVEIKEAPPKPKLVLPPTTPAPEAKKTTSTSTSTLTLDRNALQEFFPLPKAFARASVGPRGFNWLIPGVLGGTPLPGWFHGISLDLAALRRTGIQELVTLTEQPLELPEDTPLRVHHFPIVDMEPPDLHAAIEMCQRIDALIREGHTVAYHCKAGLGRTGTMLVSQLIFRGMSVENALPLARRIQKQWVQSPSQEEFLREFERAVRA